MHSADDLERSDTGNDDSRLREVRYEYTPDLPAILSHLNASILVTTYQAGKLLVIGTHQGKLQISFLSYDQPMGLAVASDRIAIGTRRQIHFLVPAHETQSGQSVYDGCFVPRSSFYTGNIHGHDLGWGQDGLWIVNTLFSTLATLHEDFSFVPQWRPPFISRLIDQDRCHLNGMAIENGQPRFVTAMSETDQAAGWRPGKANGGVVIDVATGQVVCRGLSMPHSPRIAGGRLWVLNSGHGTFGWIDRASGQFHVVDRMPGYTRGLSFCGQFAFVGLSKIRETAIFGGVPIAENRDQLRCGVGIVDLTSGKTVAVFQFFTGVSEIFAVDVLPGFSNPLVSGASIDTIEREVWIVPQENTPRPQSGRRLPIFTSVLNEQADPKIKTQETVGHLIARAKHFQSQRQWIEAAALIEQAVGQIPCPAPLLVDLGNIRQDLGNQPSAVLCYQRALESDPNCEAAMQNLGYLLFNMGEAERSHDIYDQLIARYPTPLNKLLATSVLPVVYDSTADIDYWRNRQMHMLRDLANSGEKIDATQTLVPTCFFAAYQGLCDRELMEMRGQVICGKDFTDRDRPHHGSSRLRVGFLSAYFRDHTIGRLNIGRLEKLNREQIELTIIYAGGSTDSMVDRFSTAADRFVTLPRHLPEAIAAMSNLNLDVLVHADIGMDSLTQTLAYSRFAPVQAATWGHPDTSGSRMIDYFLSSEELEVADAQSHYSERLIKLPSLAIDYERPRTRGPMKAREQLGLPNHRRLYACPQTLFKFHPEFDEILAGILDADPDGQLILLEGRVPEWTHRLKRRFRRTLPRSTRSDMENRILFLPPLPRDDFLSLLACVDVVLDPIHFGGGNSSLETIAMGTPIVTIDGQFLRSRITSALLRELELEEMVAEDSQDFVRKAVQTASDAEYRNHLQRQAISHADKIFDRSSASLELEHCLLSL